MLTNPAAVVGVLAPTIVSALVAGGRLPISTAALIGAAELAGMTLALLLGPLFVNAFDRRVVAALAVVVAACGQLLSLMATGPVAIALARAIAGFAEGVLYALAIATLAASRSPGRAFGIMVAANQVAGTALLFLAAWLSVRFPREGVIVVFTGFILATALFVVALPSRGPTATGEVTGAKLSSVPLLPAAFGIVGMFLLSAGFGSVWPLAGPIAAARGVTPVDVRHAFMIVGLGGVAAGLLATFIGARAGRVLPLVVSSSAFAVSLAMSTYAVPFIAVTLAIMFFWTFSIPFYLNVLSALDRSGRLAVLTSAMIPCGIAIGQACAGLIVTSAGFRPVTMAGAGCVAGALAAITLGAVLGRQSEAKTDTAATRGRGGAKTHDVLSEGSL